MAKSKHISTPAIEVTQNGKKFYLCALSAKELSAVASVDQRNPERDTGYQRLFVESHIAGIKKYLEAGNIIPLSLVATFKDAKFKQGKITLELDPRKGWIIDGQHRWLAARELKQDVNLPLVAFIDLPLEQQVQHFVSINKEARGVPSSLYLDLLKKLPREKTAGERVKERATDIARLLSTDENSPFYGKIVVLTSPKRGEISLTNFVRKSEPLIRKGGALGKFKVDAQVKAISNYFNGIIDAYPDEAERNPPVFFQTVGFGAFMNFFPDFFSEVAGKKKTFTRDAIRQAFVEAGDIDFSQWRQMGTGTQAENQAATLLESKFATNPDETDEPNIKM